MHTWKSWYFVGTKEPGVALKEAKAQAATEHPDTPVAAMMTPVVRTLRHGTHVMVVGKPA